MLTIIFTAATSFVLAIIVVMVAWCLLCRKPTKKVNPAPAPARKRKRWTASKLIALGVLLVDSSCTYIVLFLCWMSIRSQFSGSLPYLTALIAALQAATALVLGAYFKKSSTENSKGGITYDSAAASNFENSDL